MEKYKLIKPYPGCIYEKDTIVEFNGTSYRRKNSNTMFFITPNDVENYPEFWEKIKEKEWEILSIKYNENKLIYSFNIINDRFEHLGASINKKAAYWGSIYNPISSNRTDGKVTIHSIKRLSDGEVFTIDDKLIEGNITEFSLSKVNDGIYCNTIRCIYSIYNGLPLNKWIKSKQLLFTTEDDVKIFEGDKYYSLALDQDFKIREYIAEKYKDVGIKESGYTDNIRDFSTKEAAEQYIIENKPKYSLKDIRDIIITIENRVTSEILINKLKSLDK